MANFRIPLGLVIFRMLQISVLCEEPSNGTAIKPTLIDTPNIVLVSRGQTAVLSCLAANLGESRKSWWRGANDTFVFAVEQYVAKEYPRHFVKVSVTNVTEWSLRIEDVRQEDADTYECLIHTDVKDLRKRIQLFVSEPKFLYFPPEVSFHVGQTAELPCHVDSVEAYTVAWKFRNQLLTINLRGLADRMSVYHPYQSRWYLRIEDVQLKDAGNYSCTVATEPHMSRDVVLKVLS